MKHLANQRTDRLQNRFRYFNFIEKHENNRLDEGSTNAVKTSREASITEQVTIVGVAIKTTEVWKQVISV